MPRNNNKALTEVGVFTTATTGAYGDVSSAISGIDWNDGVQLQTFDGGMGTVGIAGVATNPGAATVSLTLTADNSALKKLKAFLQGILPANFVNWNSAAQLPAYIWSNQMDPTSKKRYKSAFVCGAMFTGNGDSIGSGNNNRQLQGQALWAMEFESAIMVDRIAGNVTPVTTLTPTKTTMLAWNSNSGSRYALAVLRQMTDGSYVLLDKALGDYTETGTSVTLTTGLGTGEAAILAYVCAPY